MNLLDKPFADLTIGEFKAVFNGFTVEDTRGYPWFGKLDLRPMLSLIIDHKGALSVEDALAEIALKRFQTPRAAIDAIAKISEALK